jgi:hypothetical protein
MGRATSDLRPRPPGGCRGVCPECELVKKPWYSVSTHEVNHAYSAFAPHPRGKTVNSRIGSSLRWDAVICVHSLSALVFKSVKTRSIEQCPHSTPFRISKPGDIHIYVGSNQARPISGIRNTRFENSLVVAAKLITRFGSVLPSIINSLEHVRATATLGPELHCFSNNVVII